MVAHLPSKQMVASSSLVSRSMYTFWLKQNMCLKTSSEMAMFFSLNTSMK